MNEETYQKIWDKKISPFMTQMKDQHPEIISIDNDAGKESKKKIKEYYEVFRGYTKMVFGKNPDDLIDHHYVCACLILAIAKQQPLQYEKGVDENGNILIFNELLALHVGLSLLQDFLEFPGNRDRPFFRNGFVFPAIKGKNHQDHSFPELLCYMLYYDNIDNTRDTYSILAIGNILLMIEEYTRLYRSNKNKKLNNQEK